MIPAASTATSVTSASPIISAEAVDAVRCGCRRELLRASAPAAPPSLAEGQPSHVARGRTSRSASTATPRKIISAPRPIQTRSPVVLWSANRAQERAANPSTVRRIEPGTRRKASREGGKIAPSWTAASGGTRVARIAGRMLARIVTTIPAVSAITTAVGVRLRPLFGSVKPDGVEEREQRFGEPEAGQEPDERREHADD